MRYRKFSYEETLALLIHAIHDGRLKKIAKQDIGIVEDYGGDRGYTEAIDQLERTERMLKLLWRKREGALGQNFPTGEFENLDAHSTAIRRNAMICFRNFLEPSAAAVGWPVSATAEGAPIPATGQPTAPPVANRASARKSSTRP